MCPRWMRKACGGYGRILYLGISVSIILWIVMYVLTSVVQVKRTRIKSLYGKPRSNFLLQNGGHWSESDFNGTWDVVGVDPGSDLVLPVQPGILKQMLQYPDRNYTEKVLVLTPIHNSADHLEHFTKTLLTLSYPRELLSLAWGEDSSHDETMAAALDKEKVLSKKFRRVSIIRLNLSGQEHGGALVKHKYEVQFARRKHLAIARNLLLKSALTDQDWVMWIDSDVKTIPQDLIQQLLSAQKDIVAPLCVQTNAYGHIKHVYDKNTWRETPQSVQQQREAPEDKLFIEGYTPSYRLYLNSLRSEGRVVPLDGVGACSLLVRADCHREGLLFPDFIYKHHIETEGLAKMARTKGYGVYGMPFVEVEHL